MENTTYSLSELGSVHLHVDGVGDKSSLMSALEATGLRSKVHEVLQHLPGMQRQSLPQLYAVHTTGFGDQEKFNSFSTTGLPDLERIDQILASIQKAVRHDGGVVLELERVIAKVDSDGQWATPSVLDDERVRIQGLDRDVIDDYPIEIHHGLDILDENFIPDRDLPLDQLLQATSHELDLGGWFLFQKENGTWAYRSNSFSTPREYREKVNHEYAYLRALCAQARMPFKNKTLVERVLGIWKNNPTA